MENRLKEIYNELDQLALIDEKYYKKYNNLMVNIIEYVSICDSSIIKEFLIENFKNKHNEYFPIWLMFLLFKVYMLKNPNDNEIMDIAIKNYSLYTTYNDSYDIKRILLADV